ncbi:hypothetical protein AKJ16_DCAP17435 [Drosera capensis]
MLIIHHGTRTEEPSSSASLNQPTPSEARYGNYHQTHPTLLRGLQTPQSEQGLGGGRHGSGRGRNLSRDAMLPFWKLKSAALKPGFFHKRSGREAWDTMPIHLKNRLSSAISNGHNSDHRIHTKSSRQNARIANEQTLDLPSLAHLIHG